MNEEKIIVTYILHKGRVEQECQRFVSGMLVGDIESSELAEQYNTKDNQERFNKLYKDVIIPTGLFLLEKLDK